MPTLHDLLWNKNLEQLKSHLKLLEIQFKPTRKAEIIEIIKSQYHGKGLHKICKSLDKLDQMAAAEACHDPQGCLRETRFKAKYGSPAKIYKESKNRWGHKETASLQKLLFYIPSARTYGIPEDLIERLTSLLPPPLKTQLKNASNLQELPEQTVYLTESYAFANLTAILYMAENGELQVSEKTGLPSAAGSKKIASNLSLGDFYPKEIAFIKKRWASEQEIGLIQPIAWALLLKNAKLISTKGSKTKLSPTGTQALRIEPHKLIKRIWEHWVQSSKFDEFNRIDDIKGQRAKGHMTSAISRRTQIVTTLQDCPVGSWIEIDDFSNYMQATGRTFEISRSPYKLYLCDPEYGNFGYSDYGEWSTVQLRYILCFLFEYAATLGIIDIAYQHPEKAKGTKNDYKEQWGADDLKWLSRYDGLNFFRLTPLGAFCLGITKEFSPSLPASKLKLSVFTNLTIKVTGSAISTSEKLLLETWSEELPDQTWRLDQERAVAAVERGRNIQDFKEFLERHDEQPLPESVQSFLQICENNGKALMKNGRGIFFTCRDPQTAKLIFSQKQLKNKCYLVGDSQLVVLEKEEKKFREIVRALGLGISSLEDQSEGMSEQTKTQFS